MDGYCSINVANHGLSRFIRFVSDLQPIHAKSFVNRLHLVLQISKIPSQNFAFTVFLCLQGGTKQGQYQSRCSVLTFGYVRKEEGRPIDSVYVQLIDMLVCYKALRCLRKEKRLAPKYSEFPIFEKKVNIFNLKIGQ